MEIITQGLRIKEIPTGEVHYPHRTCGYKNRKKYNRMLAKALSFGTLGQFTGVCTLRKLDEGDYEYRKRRENIRKM